MPLDHPEADQSFLTGIPCEYPCWYGIELDETSEDETLAILQSLDFIDNESIRKKERTRTATHTDAEGNVKNTTSNQMPYFIFDCVYSPSACGHIYFEENLVTKTEYDVAYPLTLENVITTEGPPRVHSFRYFS